MEPIIALAGTKIVDIIFDVGLEAAWRQLAADRMAIAKEVIVKELSKGHYWAITDDAAAAAIFTYLRAAQEGAARLNLELLAEALTTCAQEPTFAPDEFRRQANKLADLSREEVIVLATFIAELKNALSAGGDVIVDAKFYDRIREKLKSNSLMFPDDGTILGYCAALTRTGWLTLNQGYSASGYIPTPQLRAVERLVGWPDAAVRAQTG